jgi:hypothetical protein
MRRRLPQRHRGAEIRRKGFIHRLTQIDADEEEA